MELLVLERHLAIIEDQIVQGRETADYEVKKRSHGLDPDSPDDAAEFSLLIQERNFQIDFVHPRVLRGPFLVTLFSVYESAVTEIANLIQKKRSEPLSIEDIKGDFLGRSKKYYSSVLEFDLSMSNEHWQKLRLLSDLRNIIAHTNGRPEATSAKKSKKLLNVTGVSEEIGCIVVTGELLREIFIAVKRELDDLVARYKEWDTASRADQRPDSDSIPRCTLRGPTKQGTRRGGE